jgi:nicotinamide mononucleotide (NMN) deamidase PncC
MTDTRHLDTAIAILGGGKTKRKPNGTTYITLYDLGATGVSVQVNTKEVWLAPDMEQARADAKRREVALRSLGRIVIIQEY